MTVVGAVAAAASEAEGSGEMGEPAAVGASEAWEAVLDNVLYSASPSTNLEADPAESNTSNVFLYAASANPGGSTRLYSSTHRWYSDP